MTNMKFTIDTSEQGSHEWLKSRIGYVTASNMAAVMMAPTTSGRTNYMVKILCEVLSGEPTKGFKSSYMQAGNDNEPLARRLYEIATGNQVKEVGFCKIKELMLGASTDGEVSADGDIEIKNVIPAEQVRTITTGKIKSEYIKQMQTQMAVRNKKWVDFTSVSFGDENNGELPDKYKLKIIRVERDEKMITEILEATKKFRVDLQELKNRLETA